MGSVRFRDFQHVSSSSSSQINISQLIAYCNLNQVLHKEFEGRIRFRIPCIKKSKYVPFKNICISKIFSLIFPEYLKLVSSWLDYNHISIYLFHLNSLLMKLRYLPFRTIISQYRWTTTDCSILNDSNVWAS